MELKTKINAEDSKQDLMITRDFDLPVELLFRAYTEPEIIEEWMGNKVLKHENKNHGSYIFEKTENGNILFKANGVIHEFSPEKRIIRTFEMENTPFPVQLEFLEFEKLTEDTSRLNMQIVYRSVTDRDNMLKLPFKTGINMAHDRLEEIAGKLK